MSPEKIRITVSYDGTNFNGWQIQKRDRTVQGELEKALEYLHGEKTSIVGSGRTDSGVHAVGQVAHFSPPEGCKIPADKYLLALNSRLPRDIRVLDSSEADPDFHARYSAVEREYRYYLLPGRAAPAHVLDYCWLIQRSLDLRKLNELAEPLCGIHDFTTFTAAGDVSKSKIRKINRARFMQEGAYVVFYIHGNAFLWRMVRSLVGTLTDMEKQGLEYRDMEQRLQARDRSLAGKTAPSRGLFLHRIRYE